MNKQLVSSLLLVAFAFGMAFALPSNAEEGEAFDDAEVEVEQEENAANGEESSLFRCMTSCMMDSCTPHCFGRKFILQNIQEAVL